MSATEMLRQLTEEFASARVLLPADFEGIPFAIVRSCMNHILVIGGTGTIGRQVLSQLVARGARVRAMARNPDAARLPPQIEVVRGDLTLPGTLGGCLDGIDTVFLLWTAPPSAVVPALERIAKHARRIV